VKSIERYLLAWVGGALALGLVVVALVGYIVTLDEMNEVFDADLRNVAAAMASHRHAGADAKAEEVAEAAQLPRHPTALDDSDIVTAIWTPGGKRIFLSTPGVELPFHAATGLTRERIGDEEWLIYTIATSDVVSQAAQMVAARQVMAGETASKILPPLLILVLFTGGLLVFALRRGMRLLDQAADDVAARSEHSLTPIAEAGLPAELLPLVRSVNGLMVRLSAALSAQRRFMADAAHELRTPITALRLQLQLLERSAEAASRDAALRALKLGVDRSQRLVGQLLQVARSGVDGEPLRLEAVDLGPLVKRVVADLNVKADHKHIDLGAEVWSAVVVEGDKEQIRVLLNNLVENALRYTPHGGRIDVVATVQGGRAVLRVADNGPGIPVSEHERVFERFHRGEGATDSDDEGATGSGLGLAIVRAIAERHGATTSLGSPSEATGLVVEVSFPMSREGARA